jgi:hypothetical protein
MADQESRGGNGDSGSGEQSSVMGLNLAEGCEAVNDETRGLGFPSTSISFMRFVLFVWFEERKDQTNQLTGQTGFVLWGELCSLEAFLYKNACAGH